MPGVQRVIPGPAWRWAPPRATTDGDIAAQVGADLGWDMDPEQRWLLDAIYAETEDGLPASSEVAIIGPRQTIGKTATLEVAAIADCAVFDVPLHVWTAHEYATSQKAFQDMRSRLQAHPDYRDRVKFRDSTGEQTITFELGGTIEFRARSGGSGRGFTTSRITLDEGLYVRPGDLGALAPTLVTMPDAQVRYGSSAGKLGSDALRALRNRGRNPDPGETLAYLEFAAPRQACEDPACEHKMGTEGCALDDEDLCWQANSGLWYRRLDMSAMRAQRRMLSGAPEEFTREFLSWWDEPGAADAFGAGRWEACAGGPPPADLPVAALAIATSFDLTKAAIVAAAVDGDDVAHMQPLRHGPGTGWVVEHAKALCVQLGLAAVAVDAGGPAADLIPKLKAAVVPVRKLQTVDVLNACAGIWKRVQERRFQHASYPELEAAAAAAVQRQVGDRWAWGRKQSDGDISPLEAATFAVWLAEQAPAQPWALYDLARRARRATRTLPEPAARAHPAATPQLPAGSR